MKTLPALITVSALACSLLAPAGRTEDDLQKQIDDLKLQNALLTEQKTNATLRAEIATQAAASATDAAAAEEKKAKDRQEQYTALAANLATAAGKAPTGSYKSSGDLVITPAAAALELEAVTVVLREASDKTSPWLAGKPLVFVDALPEPPDTFGFQYLQSKHEELGRKLTELKKLMQGPPPAAGQVQEFYGLSDPVYARLYPAPRNGFLAEAFVLSQVFAVLPDAVAVIRGFFARDVTETAGKGDFPDASLVAKFIEVGHGGSGAIYVSFAAYARTKWTKPEDSAVVRQFSDLTAYHGLLVVVVPELEAKAESLKTAAEKAAEAAKAERNEAKKAALTKTAEETRSHQVLVAGYALKFKELMDEIASVITKAGDVSAKDAYFLELLKQELLFLAAKDEVRFVTLKSASDHLGLTEVKSFWSTKHYVSATVAVDLRISNTAGQVLHAAVHRRSFARKLGKADDLSAYTWDVAPAN